MEMLLKKEIGTAKAIPGESLARAHPEVKICDDPNYLEFPIQKWGIFSLS